MEKNEVTKYLFKNKDLMAIFSHYSNGNLYYTVKIEDSIYQFPIETVEEGPTFNGDESRLSMYEVSTIVLSSDLGTTKFDNEIKASYLNRWISKSIDKEDFIKII